MCTSFRNFCSNTQLLHTSHNLFVNFENTLFHRPVKMLARPRSKSPLNSEITVNDMEFHKCISSKLKFAFWILCLPSLAFWLRNIFNDAPSTLLPLNKLSKWIRICPTKNVTFISSIWITSCKITVQFFPWIWKIWKGKAQML